MIKSSKLPMKTVDRAEKNIQAIINLFPNVLTERKNAEGKIECAVDFDVLRQELSSIIVEGTEERYQFTWPNKKKSIRLADASILDTLRPCREESVGFDTTENLYIEGNNLDVLKLLRETYLGRIKMIYIDPPYNTGNDFLYSDNFAMSMNEYAEVSGEYDAAGNHMVKNLDSNGRFHTDWLNSIYPPLRVSKDLLSDDGVIFISIDENEVHNLQKICDDIFGGTNFISLLVWQNKKGGGNDSQFIATEHEFILVYAKSKQNLQEFYELYSDEYIARYKEEDEKGKYFWDTFKRKSGKQYYPIECPDGTIIQYDDDGNPISWLRSEPRFLQDLREEEVRIVKIKDKWSVQFKQRMPEGKKPRSIFKTEFVVSDKGTTSLGAEDVYEYFKKMCFQIRNLLN